jgi:hypothetical protein
LQDRATADPSDEDNEPLDEDEQELLKALVELREECEGSGWRDGIGFVRETYWRDYCEELASDVGYFPSDRDTGSNPLWSCIDWDKWADLVAQDYQQTDIGGVSFYWREA